jgi:hypothetical protein
MSCEICGETIMDDCGLTIPQGGVCPKCFENLFKPEQVEQKSALDQDLSIEVRFWTVNTRTQAGVERQVFTFAKSPTEAWEKVEKHFANEHAKFLEKYGDEAGDYFGREPLIKVTGVIWKDTFIA